MGIGLTLCLSKISFHDLRLRAFTHMVNWGVLLPVVLKVAGHKNLTFSLEDIKKGPLKRPLNDSKVLNLLHLKDGAADQIRTDDLLHGK